MTDREIAFDWRATMGITNDSPNNSGTAAPPSDIAAYLDLVSDLCQDDGYYLYRTANRHTCACDDPMVMLHHVRLSKLCTTPADHRLYDSAVSYVRANKPMYFSDSEIDRRMKNADGDCPMCGTRPSFHGLDHNNRRTMMTRCQHIMNYSVEGDTDAFLRQPRVWEGKSWPYAWMQGHKITAGVNGEKVLQLNGSAPCQGCLEMDAMENMERAIFKLIETGNQPQFTKPGWNAPTSYYSEGSADQQLMRVKGVVADAQDSFSGSKEIRLNGAGLKLFITPVRSGTRVREVNFGLRVGGDQERDYPGFQEFAHALFESMGVPTST